MPQPNDLSRSLVALDQNSTIIAVVEMSQSSWLVGGILPGIERQPRKKLEPSPERLLAVLPSAPSCPTCAPTQGGGWVLLNSRPASARAALVGFSYRKDGNPHLHNPICPRPRRYPSFGGAA